VLQGEFGAYRLIGAVTDVVVPATLHATISARIDRLSATSKGTLSSGAVIGTRFDVDLLSALVDNPDTATLVQAELVDQVKFSAPAVYAFRHPLIRAVAYESQLKSVRAQLHRRLATAIEQRESADEHAALIAEHLESAGDLRAAFLAQSTIRRRSAAPGWPRPHVDAHRPADSVVWDRLSRRRSRSQVSLRRTTGSVHGRG
jgi:adenylate cyclase